MKTQEQGLRRWGSRRLEFKHGEPAAEPRLEIFQGAVAGAEDDVAGRFVEVIEEGQHAALGGLGHQIAFLEPDGFVVGVEISVGQAGGDVVNAFEVDFRAVELGDAELGTAQHVVDEPARERRFADPRAAVDQDGHGSVLVRARLGDEGLEAARGGGRAEIAVADKIGGRAGDEFGGSCYHKFKRRWLRGNRREMKALFKLLLAASTALAVKRVKVHSRGSTFCRNNFKNLVGFSPGWLLHG